MAALDATALQRHNGTIPPLKIIVLVLRLLTAQQPPPAQPSASSTAHTLAPSAAPAIRYDPTYTANNPNARQPGTFRIQPDIDP